ncbi:MULTISPECIES: TerD family protein [unclassified Streptomyces]|uniref:TerD family protein n=1 Tax=unclassified Streptomyces TaxID=2593676 RepID=UPI0004C0A6D6|nr:MULTISPECIES: TerD family protein [unclassified Streptomyces]
MPASGSVQLSRGQQVVLRRAGVRLSTVRVQVSWQAVRRRGLFRSRLREIDLDVSAVLFADRQPVDVVFFRHLVSDDGSVRHTGDSLVDDVDEAVLVSLQRVPVHIDAIIMTLNSFTGQTFIDVESVRCRVIDENTKQEVVGFVLTGGDQSTARILVRLSRLGSEDWSITMLDVPANGRTFQDLMPAMMPLL